MFSNSLGTTSDMWQAQVAKLCDSFHIIRYDTRGHGRSASPKGPYSLDMLGNDVVALLDDLQVERVNFCGISMGGLIGQWLGIHAPNRIERLLLANTAAKVGESSAWLNRAAQVRAQGLGSIADTAETRWFTPKFLSASPECVSAMIETMRGVNQEGYASCCEALAYTDLTSQIKNISCETLIIAGAHDPVTTVDDAQTMHQSIERSHIKTINASHLSCVEQPQEFNAAITNFF
jgi:3-oxoadipate enol-lactonase